MGIERNKPLTGEKKMAKIDPYEKVTNKIVEALEQGTVPWKKPWNIIGGLMPMNVESKKPYNGINLLMTASAGYQSPFWGTFNNWKDRGGYVTAGKSLPIIKWLNLEKKDANGQPILKKNGQPETFMYPKIYDVWNSQDVKGIDLSEYIPETKEIIETNEIIEAAQAIVDGMTNRPVINHGGNVACYTPTLDIVKMPLKAQFEKIAEYYSTLFHELSHSTGHSSRVGRDLSPTAFGSDKYSFEELIAEISTCFICSMCGIEQTFDNSAAYIKGWVSKLKNDKQMVVKAASKARYSAEYIMGKQAQTVEAEAEAIQTV
jgi:antirestriction protein ArdC